MSNKKDMSRIRKVKKNWKELNENDIKLLEKKGFKDKLNDFKKMYMLLRKPIRTTNRFIGDEFYKFIQINEVMIYSNNQDIPTNCLLLPKTYKNNILKYFPRNNQALILVMKREEIKIPIKDIKIKIIDVIFKNVKFVDKFPFKRKESYPFGYMFKNIDYNIETNTEGMFTFEFFFDIEDIDRMKFTGISRIISDYQKEIKILLDNRNREFEDFIYNKLLYKCLLKCKEMSEEEDFPFPDVEWILEIIKKLKQK